MATERSFDLLPVKYYHTVSIIPSELYNYFRFNKRSLYNLLFRRVQETFLEFGQDPKHGIGVKIGAIGVLHTCMSAVQDFGRRDTTDELSSAHP